MFILLQYNDINMVVIDGFYFLIAASDKVDNVRVKHNV